MIESSRFTPSSVGPSHHVDVFPVLKRRRQHRSNIWFFESPKNNERLAITSDLAFMHLVLLEGDTSVARYVLTRPEDKVCEQPAVTIYRLNGGMEWWSFRRAGRPRQAGGIGCDAALALAASAAGASYIVKTERDLVGKELLFDNWLHLCAAITRCRSESLVRELSIVTDGLRSQRELVVGNLTSISGIDVACMLAVIAQAIRIGQVHTDLTNRLFGSSSILSRSRS
ncbi:hypothetical protein [Collimonas humicola]|uniref:hypothetical protein n=1 Tax=Collimonas humicola TaxID=2825886 RepID=UPI001B8B1D36|nr:hypothetical protein [Collimonas humicola]